MTEQGLLVLVTALAGGIGAMLRFVVDGAIMARHARRTRGSSYPWGVLVVNLTGSFAIGVLAGALAPNHPLATVLGVGLLGGYTTFSTASYDTVRLIQRGRLLAGFLNGVGQLAAAVLAAMLGFGAGSLLS